jgi:hypothetical protein
MLQKFNRSCSASQDVVVSLSTGGGDGGGGGYGDES